MNNNLKFIKGDAIEIFKSFKTSAILMHGANCQNIMGAGIARQIKKTLPELFIADTKCDFSPKEKLGKISYHRFPVGDKGQEKIGVNLYTQFNLGADFSLKAFEKSLEIWQEVSESLSLTKDFTYILPKIGSGIGGGNWKEILDAIKNHFLVSEKVIIVEYDK